MENFDYSELKSSLSAISVKALNLSSRLTLANNLDSKQALLSSKNLSRDYRGLADLIGLQYCAIKKLEEFQDRTMKILESWEARPDATLDKLITFLEDMDRHDIIQELIPSLKVFIVEDNHYSELKRSLSAISVKDLNYSSRLHLAHNLDCKQVLLSRKGLSRDYRGLGELIGLQYLAIKKLEDFEDRTMKILESWETRPDATLDKLMTYLEDMDRHDIIQELIPSLKKHVEAHLKSIEIPIQVAEVSSGPTNLTSKAGIITRGDLQSGKCTMYDVYVSYAVEDTNIAKEFASILESSQVGLKLFIRGRDMLAGVPELDANIEVIKNRCRHVLIILTPNFVKSPALEFQVSFAGSLAIEQKERILVPVVLEPCEIPSVLNGVSKIDLTQQNTYDWMMGKLISSLMPEDKVQQSAACSETKDVSSLSKKFQQFMLFLKRKRNSSSACYTSFSSGATN